MIWLSGVRRLLSFDERHFVLKWRFGLDLWAVTVFRTQAAKHGANA